MQSRQDQSGVAGVWRSERHARWFFAAHLQGALGTGAGYVALLLLAYEQLGSAWGATAVLIADLLPAMFLGPLLGSLIDRTSRLGCAIAADLIGGIAFAGLIFAHGAAQLVALAVLAGVGSALLRPATCALLPSIVHPDRLSAANGVFGAVREIGQLIGPAVAAAVLLFSEPELVLALNAVTFAASAFLLTRLRGHWQPVHAGRGDGRRGPDQPAGRPARAARALARPDLRRRHARGRRDQRRRARARQRPARRRPHRLRPARQRLRLRDARRLAARAAQRRGAAHPLPRGDRAARHRPARHRRRARPAARDAHFRDRRDRQRPLPRHRPRADAEADPRAASTAAPSACSTRSTPGASAPRSSPAARSPPASAAARRSPSPARSRWSSWSPRPAPSARPAPPPSPPTRSSRSI